MRGVPRSNGSERRAWFRPARRLSLAAAGVGCAMLKEGAHRADVPVTSPMVVAIIAVSLLGACSRQQSHSTPTGQSAAAAQGHASAALGTGVAPSGTNAPSAAPSRPPFNSTASAETPVANASAEPAASVVPAPVVARADVVARAEHLFVSSTHTCLRTAPTTLRCWGERPNSKPVPMVTYRDTVAKHGPFLERVDGAWGYDELEVSVDLPSAMADMSLKVGESRAYKRIPELGGAALVDGGANACALLGDRVLCWGFNDAMQLGYDSDDGCYVAGYVACSRKLQAPRGVGKVAELAVGRLSTCVRQAAGGVLCWGLLVDARAVDCAAKAGACKAKPPVAVVGLEDATQIVGPAETLCGLKASGGVACLGPDFPFREGELRTRDRHTAVPIQGFESAVRIALSGEQLCAIQRDGGVRCKRACGGQQACAPTDVPGLSGVTELAVGGWHACALRSDQSLWCWGSRSRIGLEGKGEVTTPVQVVVTDGDIREAEDPTRRAGASAPSAASASAPSVASAAPAAKP